MFYRIVLAVVVTFVICMGLLGIRYYFDQKDIFKAKEIFSSVMIESRQNEANLVCEPQIISRYEGKILFNCLQNNKELTWLVNIYHNEIKPLNEFAQEAMPKN